MTTLVLIRHGQTDWNVEGRWQGQADPSLNEYGRVQARHVAQELEQQNLVALYSSDLRRAWETAHIIGTQLHLCVIPEPRLREINLGLWQGMLSTGIQAQYPREFQEWHTSPLVVHPPGGESILVLAARVLQGVNEIIARHPNESIGIVAHEFPIAVVLCRVAGMPFARIREMIPKTSTWKQTECDGELT
jgi:broad specificity phosphatase PhoE